MSWIAKARKVASRCLTPLALRAAKAYVAGEHLDDALTVADRLADRGMGATVGYWDAPDEAPRTVADAYLEGVAALAGREHAYLSIKVPSLQYRRELMDEVVAEAMRQRVRLHFDALSPETVDPSRALFEQFLDAGAELSFTLPGRWARSVGDAAWAAERGVMVRVVKGQWPDSAAPNRDPSEGFLEVIDALVGRARHVAVASHDVSLAIEAINRLRKAGTSCGLELLYGLPMPRSLEMADRMAVGVHVYVPYGRAYLPYALSRVRNNPRILWWLVRDAVLACCATLHADREEHELVDARKS
jgi:proline dehydrogenase